MVLNDLDGLDEKWDSIAHYLFETNYTVSNEQKTDTNRRIREYYFGDKDISKEVDKLVKVRIVFDYLLFALITKSFQLFTDRYNKLEGIRASQVHSKVAKSSVYTVVYGYRGSRSFLDILIPLDIDLGTV